MGDVSLGEVIAERYFEAQDEDGARREVVLRVGKPVPDPEEGGDWCCPYQIVGFGGDRVSPAYGVDSVQALLFGLQKAALDLKHYQQVQKSRLTWLGQEQLGLPGV